MPDASPKMGKYEYMAVVNKNDVLERLGGDEDLYKDICRIFVRDVPMMLQRMKEELEAGRVEIATRYAYSIKSIASNVGADDLMELARTAEMAGRTADAGAMTGYLESLETAFAEVTPLLPTARED